MKAADIAADALLAAVEEARRRSYPFVADRWAVTAILAGHPEHVGTRQIQADYPNMPAKVVLAKAKRLILRGVLEGCFCGCRGDWEVKRSDRFTFSL